MLILPFELLSKQGSFTQRAISLRSSLSASYFSSHSTAERRKQETGKWMRVASRVPEERVLKYVERKEADKFQRLFPIGS